MAVSGGSSARTALRDLLRGAPPGGPTATWLHQPYLPDGTTAGTDAPPAPTPPAAGYLDDATYAFGADAALLDRSPADALDTLDAADLATYQARSVDLTMRGGTTSGVVYPLAVCEVARDLRVRNVGGASAGAIAAAATAAAELGRSRLAAGTAHGSDPQPGHLHPGFHGLADIVAWLTQLDGSGGADDEFRLASLFQPAAATRALWRVVTALMRRRLWAALPLAVVAFGTRWIVAAVVVLAAAVATAATLLPDGTGFAGRAGYAAGHLAGLTLLATGVVGALLRARESAAARTAARRLHRRPPDQLRLLDVTSASPVRPSRNALLTWVVLALVGVGAEVGLGVAAGSLGRSLLVAVPVALALVALLVAGTALVALRFLGSAEAVHYGLLSGATRTPGAGRPLVPWLDDCLSELAGQPGRSVTFGDLWFGDQPYTAWPADDPRRTRVATDARRRLVNLQLVTTDLTQQRAVCFPLDPAGPGTGVPHVQPDDLHEVFGPELTAQLCPASTATTALVQEPDGSWREIVVHPLPDAADLPVIFAVRLSLALPGLFTAVRTYRLRAPSGVRDDGGHSLAADGAPLRWPPTSQVGTGTPVAEAVWFSDGGITSNFPVQLFDTLLPQWPTFGLNLGPHPEGFEHQDVWLPEDWQSGLPPAVPVGAGALGLLGALLDTARSWRDTAQTGMPSTRGRVAWVRQRSTEGGANLYMGRDVIASLALRGAYAGARLRQRYTADEHGARPSWARHRWLRLRVSARALEDQRSRLAAALPGYLPLLEPGAGAAAAAAPSPTVPKPLYVPDDPAFAPGAADLLARAGSSTALPSADDESPQPAPELTLTPPM